LVRLQDSGYAAHDDPLLPADAARPAPGCCLQAALRRNKGLCAQGGPAAQSKYIVNVVKSGWPWPPQAVTGWPRRTPLNGPADPMQKRFPSVNVMFWLTGSALLAATPACAAPHGALLAPLAGTALGRLAASAAPLMIPEPASLALLIVGLTMSAVAARRRK
jgi:hypothetical protein